MNAAIVSAMICVVAICMAAAWGHASGRQLATRWAICVVVATALVLAGMSFGAVARSAMCAGPWVCK
jgi:hypothetical protein